MTFSPHFDRALLRKGYLLGSNFFGDPRFRRTFDFYYVLQPANLSLSLPVPLSTSSETNQAKITVE